MLFTVALAKRWAPDGITVNALHPGGIMTNLQRHLDDDQLAFVGAKMLLSHWIEISTVWSLVIMAAILGVCAIVSILFAPQHHPGKP